MTAAEGFITVRSSYGPKDTMKRLEAEVKAKGLSVFAHVDHATGAAAVGLPLRPTDLLIFGNAKGGTPLMQSVQTIGIDLPLKVPAAPMLSPTNDNPPRLRRRPLRCEISIRPMSQSGHPRPMRPKAPEHVCPLLTESGQTGRRLGTCA